jgi:hypothetical protein
VQGEIPELEFVVAGRLLAAGQAAVHLLEVGGRRPGHHQPHRRRFEHPPDRHHVGGRELGGTAGAVAAGGRRCSGHGDGGTAVPVERAAIAGRAGPARVAQEGPPADLA